MNSADTPTVDQLCEALNIKRVELAKRLGVCQMTVQRWASRGVPKQGSARHSMKTLWEKAKQEQAGGVTLSRP